MKWGNNKGQAFVWILLIIAVMTLLLFIGMGLARSQKKRSDVAQFSTTENQLPVPTGTVPPTQMPAPLQPTGAVQPVVVQQPSNNSFFQDWMLYHFLFGGGSNNTTTVEHHYDSPAPRIKTSSDSSWFSSKPSTSYSAPKSYSAPQYSKPSYSAPSRSYSAPSYSRPSFGGRR